MHNTNFRCTPQPKQTKLDVIFRNESASDLHENTHSAGQSWKFEVQYFMKQVFKCPIDLPAKFD